jgi:hypothetical protein
MKNARKPLDIKIKDELFQITIGVDTLIWALENAPCCPFKISDKSEFLKEFLCSLGSEEEDGATLIHRAFDEAANNAFENGAEGMKDIYDDEDDGDE